MSERQNQQNASVLKTTTVTIDRCAMNPASGGLNRRDKPETLPRVAEVMARTLLELGVHTYFGVPGGAICSYYDALLDIPETRTFNTRHETGAAFMGMGHWRAGGGLPGLLMTSGPGITNALTGLAAAYADGVPMIAIGGEVPRANFGRGALQEGSRYELDVLSMVRSVTKMSAEVANPKAAASLVRKAVATALSGRQGPVFLSLPLDSANERVHTAEMAVQARTHFELDEKVIRQVAALLQNSERGLILVGSGARHPDAVRAVAQLAQTLNIPVATSPKAKGIFPESSPLSLGILGLAGHASASDYLKVGVDTLLCVGCGLGENGTNSWSSEIRASQAFIQIDIDAARIGRNYPVDFGLVGPADVVLQALLREVKPRLRPASLGGIRPIKLDPREAPEGTIGPNEAIIALQQRFPEETLFTCDIGEHAMFALQSLRIDRPDAFQFAAGLGSMGSGIGAAIGAKVAQPNRPVLGICGDFGFHMYGMELATCVQNQIPVVFAIFNDARMRMVESGLSRIFGRTGRMDGPRTDFVALARSVGADGAHIQSVEDIQKLPDSVWKGSGPFVLDLSIDPGASFPAHGRVAHLKNFAAQ
jgi:acetolactate synthase-1/2/3 large subunit